jgi:hypothetical protein
LNKYVYGRNNPLSKPLDGSPELSAKQQKAVDQSKGAIRKAVDQIQRYKKYNDQ